MSRLSNHSLLLAVFLSLAVFFSPSFAALGDVEKVPADPDVGKEMGRLSKPVASLLKPTMLPPPMVIF